MFNLVPPSGLVSWVLCRSGLWVEDLVREKRYIPLGGGGCRCPFVAMA